MSYEELSIPVNFGFPDDFKVDVFDITGEITNDTHATNKLYVENIFNTSQNKKSVRFINTSAFPGSNYTASGYQIGKTLTGTSTLPNIFDGGVASLNDRLLIITENEHNGIYTLTQLNPYILTRSLDADTEIDNNNIDNEYEEEDIDDDDEIKDF